MSVYASRDIPEDSKIISCPFSVAITPARAKRSLGLLFGSRSTTTADLLNGMSERQLLCLYIITHWILREDGSLNDLEYRYASSRAIRLPSLNATSVSKSFNHLPYLNTLPSVSALRTPIHFNRQELELLRGTNLYGATLDRKEEWKIEWTEARQCIADFRRDWHDKFTWLVIFIFGSLVWIVFHIIQGTLFNRLDVYIIPSLSVHTPFIQSLPYYNRVLISGPPSRSRQPQSRQRTPNFLGN